MSVVGGTVGTVAGIHCQLVLFNVMHTQHCSYVCGGQYCWHSGRYPGCTVGTVAGIHCQLVLFNVMHTQHCSYVCGGLYCWHSGQYPLSACALQCDAHTALLICLWQAVLLAQWPVSNVKVGNHSACLHMCSVPELYCAQSSGNFPFLPLYITLFLPSHMAESLLMTALSIFCPQRHTNLLHQTKHTGC
jgi:hypothetical protein